LEQIYLKYHQQLLQLAFRITGEWEAAADVVQDVFLKLLKDKTPLSGVQSPERWLKKIVVNRALDHQRLLWQRLKRSLENWELPGVRFKSDYEERDQLQHLLRQLAPRERTVLVLRDLEGYKVNEIAAVLNIAESTVRVLSKTARDKFTRLYREEVR